jgi:hypothetical protein
MRRFINKFFFPYEMEINSYKKDKIIDTILLVVRIFIICLITFFLFYLGYSFLNKQRQQELIHTTVIIDVRNQAVVKIPYDNINDFISRSYPCVKQFHFVNEFNDLYISPFVTTKKTSIWTIANLTMMFTYLQHLMEDYEKNGLFFFCTTMLGIQDSPCGCVMKTRQNETIWLLDLFEKHKLEIKLDKLVDRAIIIERSFIFKSMHDKKIKKILPTYVDIGIASCNMKSDRLYRKNQTKIFEKEDILTLNRLLYFLDFNPNTYDQFHPDFGTFIYD